MDVFRNNSAIHLKLALEERLFLIRVLTSIRGNYQIRPSDMEPKGARAWYDTKGCPIPGEREREDWIEQLHQSRSDHLGRIENWLASLSRSTSRKESLALTLTFEEAPAFLQVINDHRLLMVHRHELGERELASDFNKVIQTLEPQRQLALCDVNLLAHIMEYILQALPGSGADWMDVETSS